MSFPAYESYRESGVEWLGEVPSHWTITRFKQVFQERDERSEAGLEELLSVSAYTGVKPRRDLLEDGDHLSRAESLVGYKRCYPDDLVMNIMLAWNRGLGFAQQEGIVSPAYCVFDVLDSSCPRFLDYLVRDDQTIRYFRSYSAGVIDSRLRLYPDAFLSLSCILPPPEEQAAIAAFLDRETGKIDALVEEQKRLIELLKEKRQAVISHAVTKGLDPTVPMKDSSVEWLGEVPAHWEVVQIRRVVRRLEQGWSPDCIARPADDEEWGILKTGCVNGGVYRDAENKALPAEMEPRDEYEVRIGDVLMSRASGSPDLIGSVARVAATRGKILLSDKIFRLLCEAIVDPDFVVWTFAARPMRCQIVNAISGAEGMANNLPQSRIKEFWLALPPVSEQSRIGDFLSTSTRHFDELANQASAAITLLQERRAALISAAVTGKIDVRGIAPKASVAA